MSQIITNNLFYFDIETVGQYPTYDKFVESDLRGSSLFKKRYDSKQGTNLKKWDCNIESAYLSNSPLLPEYGKIVCLSVGVFDNNSEFKLKSLTNDDEFELMKNIQKIFNNAYNHSLKYTSSEHKYSLCGFNIKAFDIPYIVKKFHKYGLSIPLNLNFFGKKPWEIDLFDLFEIWNTNSREYITFDEVCLSVGVESPKSGISGADVHNTYWNENGINKISEYCEKDVLASKDVAIKLFDNIITE